MEQHNLIDVVEFCRLRHLNAEVVGRWVWVQFESKPSAEIREELKAFGFRWVGRRGKWAHNCGHPSRHGKGDPRFKYPTRPVDEYETAAA